MNPLTWISVQAECQRIDASELSIKWNNTAESSLKTVNYKIDYKLASSFLKYLVYMILFVCITLFIIVLANRINAVLLAILLG